MKDVKFLVVMLLVLLIPMSVSADLVHRYSFISDASDSVGSADGTVETGASIADGQAHCDGAGGFVDLPGPTIAINQYTTGLTIELWSTQPEIDQTFSMTACLGGTWGNGMGKDYLAISTTRGSQTSRAMIANTLDDSAPWEEETGADGPELNDAVEHHYVLTIDDPSADGTGTLSYFIDGVLQATVDLNGSVISGVDNTFCYLGKGIYSVDGSAECSVNEFRIYDRPLTEAQIDFNYENGPDEIAPIASMSPKHMATEVAFDPQTELSWTVNTGVQYDNFEVFISTDPNSISQGQTPSGSLAGSPEVTNLDVTGLAPNTEYGWRVDVIEGATRVVGPVAIFTTAAEGPVLVASPSNGSDFEGGTVSFTAVFHSTEVPSVKWFKAGDTPVEITDADADVAIATETVDETTTTTLTISNIELADEGDYYAQASNSGGTKDTLAAKLTILKMIAYYPFEDGDAGDVTGLAPEVAVMGTVDFVSGQVGDAVILNGDPNDFIDLGDGFDDFSTGMTINVWANPTTHAAWTRLVAFGNGPATDNIYFTRNGGSNLLHFDTWNGALISPNDAIALNEWQMFTATVDPEGTGVLYKNGLPIANGSIGVPAVITRTECFIGKSNWSDPTFIGLIDELKVYNYALTEDDVAVQYAEDFGPFCRNRPVFDHNNDCVVDINDFAIFAAAWMECGIYPETACFE